MQLSRPVGREAASRKYDILSAMVAFALAQDKHVQRQVLRLMALITTRYNWQRDELSMGQAEIARLWSVDERTVKREMARMRAQGWLVQKRQGARGRVSLHGLDLERIMHDTRPVWPLIGEDFIARVAPVDTPPSASNVVPLRVVAVPQQERLCLVAGKGGAVESDAAAYGAWFHPLALAGIVEGTLTLAAPTRFHASYVMTHLHGRLLAAMLEVDPTLGKVIVIG